MTMISVVPKKRDGVFALATVSSRELLTMEYDSKSVKRSLIYRKYRSTIPQGQITFLTFNDLYGLRKSRVVKLRNLERELGYSDGMSYMLDKMSPEEDIYWDNNYLRKFEPQNFFRNFGFKRCSSQWKAGLLLSYYLFYSHKLSGF